MPMAASDIEALIRSGIPDAKVIIEDLRGDGDHYAALVISEAFRGKSRVAQHQLVYAAMQGKMGGELHAMVLQTVTPENAPDYAKD
ncbi:MAG: BolA family transcriptional regulator [Magnetospirillum sp.]|nr:BolA family transcriptional regulator [Magnetospirillum sp.]